MYYVYALIDPRTNAPFYIGKGQRSRIDFHEMEARNGVGSKKCARIREIWAEGLQVQKTKVRLFQDEVEAYDFEREKIEEIGIDNLTNATKGGKCPGHIVRENSIRGDLNILRIFGNFKARAKDYLPGSMFYRLYRNHAEDVREVMARRGIPWVNAMAHRTGVFIENNR